MAVLEKKEVKTEYRWKRLLNYQSVVRQVPFFLFLSVLAVIYIYNGHQADKLAREITKTTRELKELEYEYKTVKGEVLFRSKQSELVKVVAPLGLKELNAPPVILTDSSSIDN
jgi:cell division protein FtsL